MNCLRYVVRLCVLLVLIIVFPVASYAYTLSGHVYGSSGALASVEIKAYDVSTSNQIGSTATSDASGNYSITNLPNGTYKLYVAPPNGSGYNDAWILDPPVIINNADLLRDITMLLPTSSISGVVRNPAGVGTSNISVCAYSSLTSTSKCTVSDTSGAYSITGLDVGTYRISVSRSGTPNVPAPYSFSITGYVPSLSVSGNTTQDVSLPFITLSGKTTDSNGVAVASVSMYTYPSWTSGSTSYSVTGNVTSDANGNYSMVLLSYNSYSISITPPSGGQFVPGVVSPYSLLVSKVQNIILSKGNPEHRLTVALSGTGAGVVSSNDSNISCASGSCSWVYDENTVVTLTATPDFWSSFTGWSGGGCSSVEKCVVTMDVAKEVTAIFAPLRYVKIADLFYGGIGKAYQSATDGQVMKVSAREFVENINFDNSVSVVLQGGYDTDFISPNGYSSIAGTVTVSQGSLVVDGIVIK